jgi:hypothetical protein
VPEPEQVSVVHGLASLQSLAEQHSRHSAPQSLGVPAAHWQALALQIAPGLQAFVHAPQCALSLVRSVSQPSDAWLLQSPKSGAHSILPLTQT